MHYDQYFIDDLKNRADLVRIIEPYAPLKKKGANWMGCCPFHREKTPSFSVNPAKGFYKCFGCGKGGNAYTFLMEIEGLTFPEAIARVAETSGISLPEPIDDKQYERNKKRREEKKAVAEQVMELNKYATEFWENALSENNAHAKAAREYLESREISPETIKKFRIGFSPDSWDALLTILKEKGADEKLMETSGLVSVNAEKQRIYDRFRGRIMFPVLDVRGNAIAFGARIIDKGEPKYLNSPETPAYIKGEHLYGLFQNQTEIRKKKFAILVEGYLDLIALYQIGITNVAASLGTAFTPEQAKLLGRFAKKVVVNYDGDSAGVKAARRAIDTLLAHEFDIKVLQLPEGNDPDDFVRANGAESYNLLRGKAFPYLQFVLQSAVQERDINLPHHKAEAIEDVLPVLSVVRNPIQLRESFDATMNFFRVESDELKRELWKTLKSGAHVDAAAIRSTARRMKPVTVAEQKLLEFLIFDRELRDEMLPNFEVHDFEHLATAEIFIALRDLNANGDEISLENVLKHLGDDESLADYATVLMLGEPKRAAEDPIDEVLRDAQYCLFSLRLMALAGDISDINREMNDAQQRGNFEEAAQLSLTLIERERLRHDLQRRLSAN